jgi:hypothetical protein
MPVRKVERIFCPLGLEIEKYYLMTFVYVFSTAKLLHYFSLMLSYC